MNVTNTYVSNNFVEKYEERKLVNKPMVSIIVPTTHNRHHFLPRIIDCFNKQTYNNKELIIYDTDSSKKYKIDNTHNIRYYKSDNKVSIGQKRNFMVRQARGEYICHFDDDDYYFPEYIETMMNKIGDYDFIKLSSYTLYYKQEDIFKYHSVNGKQTLGDKFSFKYGYGFTYIYKKKWLLDYPMDDINFAEDSKWLKKVIDQGMTYKYILEDDKPLVIHTIHGENTSNHFHNEELPWDYNYLKKVGFIEYKN